VGPVPSPDSHSPIIFDLGMLMGQAKTLHIIHGTIPPGFPKQQTYLMGISCTQYVLSVTICINNFNQLIYQSGHIYIVPNVISELGDILDETINSCNKQQQSTAKFMLTYSD